MLSVAVLGPFSRTRAHWSTIAVNASSLGVLLRNFLPVSVSSTLVPLSLPIFPLGPYLSRVEFCTEWEHTSFIYTWPYCWSILFIEGPVFSPMCTVGLLVKNQWWYECRPQFMSLIWFCWPMALFSSSAVVGGITLQCDSTGGTLMPPTLLHCSQVFWLPGSLGFLANFKIIFISISVRSCIGILMRIILTL